jgi:hypothetical protein
VAFIAYPPSLPTVISTAIKLDPSSHVEMKLLFPDAAAVQVYMDSLHVQMAEIVHDTLLALPNASDPEKMPTQEDSKDVYIYVIRLVK